MIVVLQKKILEKKAHQYQSELWKRADFLINLEEYPSLIFWINRSSLPSFSDLTLFHSWHFIEFIFLGEKRPYCRFIVVDACFCELLSTIESILILPRNFDKPIRHYLHDLSPLRRSVSRHLPFIQVLLRVELNCEYRVFFGFHYGNEFFVVGRCGSANQIPKFP